MRSLILSLCLAVAVFATSESALNSNKLMDTCEDCQSVIDRFITASGDSFKIQELKSVLGAGCEKIPYATECKTIVRNLESVVRRMQPYVKDRRAVCRKMKMCDSAHTSDFARLFLLVAKKHMNSIDGTKDNVCAECQMAATGISKNIGNKSRQNHFVRYIKKTFCRHLGRHADTCRASVNEIIPLFFSEIEALFEDTTKACGAMGMCKTSGKSSPLMKSSGKTAAKIAQKFWKDVPTLKTRVGHVRMNCLECEIIMDGVLVELQSNKTSYALGYDLRDAACGGLPADFLLSCDDFLTLYAPTVVELTTRQFTVKGLCQSFLHTCESSEAQLHQLSRDEKDGMACEACKGTVAYMRTALTQPDIQSDVMAGLDSYACKAFPGTFAPLCENLVQTFVPKIFNKIVETINDEYFCSKRIHAC